MRTEEGWEPTKCEGFKLEHQSGFDFVCNVLTFELGKDGQTEIHCPAWTAACDDLAVNHDAFLHIFSTLATKVSSKPS